MLSWCMTDFNKSLFKHWFASVTPLREGADETLHSECTLDSQHKIHRNANYAKITH